MTNKKQEVGKPGEGGDKTSKEDADRQQQEAANEEENENIVKEC